MLELRSTINIVTISAPIHDTECPREHQRRASRMCPPLWTDPSENPVVGSDNGYLC